MTDFIIKKAISKDVLAKAEKVPIKKKLNSRTIMDKGEGQLTGAVGEIMMLELFEAYYEGDERIEHANTYDYDIVLGDNFKLDVKSKRRGVEPRKYYNATVAAYSLPIQLCAAYYFTSITFDGNGKPKDFYFLGSLSKSQFKARATFGKQGEPDGGNLKANREPFVFTADCWNLPYGDLDIFPASDANDLKRYGFEIIKW